MAHRERIRRDVISPQIRAHATIESYALVIETNETYNTCTIQYNDRKGNLRYREGVQVKLYNSGIIDWFPMPNDVVAIVQTPNDDIYITGSAENSYPIEIRPKNRLIRDIYSDMLGSNIGGYIW